MSSSSSYRRNGRQAFFRGGDPRDHNPYWGKPGLTADVHSSDWMRGWEEAKQHDDLAKEREAREAIEDDEKVEEFARLYNLAKDRGLLS